MIQSKPIAWALSLASFSFSGDALLGDITFLFSRLRREILCSNLIRLLSP